MSAHRPVRRFAPLAAACALLAAGGAAAPAQASPAQASPAPAAQPGPQTPHCIADRETGEQRCFATFTAAVEAATGGRIDDAPKSPHTAARNPEFRQSSAAAEVIQGTFFEHDGYGGASLTIYGAEPCVKDGWVNFQYDLDDWWKDRISSVQPWANCWLWLYPEPDLGGDRDGPFKENTPDIGTFMNDRTESIGFS
ncbi:hypothetical protein [Streptomyces sp. JJ36]|uniref:hypothetical protein n=1 Tax=Streptomyces sp. JJ36 TaxID=2736645 RepID=UPI001F361D93|nr:hypothetical protein [Streptomyces sp. JJ36]MCF6521586.1 hypothetical protein [Streptomyces sp. JJ36]